MQNKSCLSLGRIRNSRAAYNVSSVGERMQHQPCGELLVSIGIQPGAVNRLSIALLKARKLTSIADHGLQIKPSVGRSRHRAWWLDQSVECLTLD